MVETWTPSNETVIVALALNPLPFTVTCASMLPEVGFSATERVTVKEVVALLLLLSVTPIGWAPAVDEGIVIVAENPPRESEVIVEGVVDITLPS